MHTEADTSTKKWFDEDDEFVEVCTNTASAETI
jgi:hypothetical protein